MKTKEKIISHAIQHFNQQGFGATSLHQLAREIGISRGNLTYHFKTKELLLKAIVDDMWKKLDVQRTKSRELPSFENLQNEITLFQQFQQEYAFVFLDPQVFLVPDIQVRLQGFRAESISHFMAVIAFSIRVGNMKQEEIPGTYHNICRMLWMISFYWNSQQSFLENSGETSWDKMMWSMLLPHFTEKGINAFIAYFGGAYYQALGKPFDSDRKAFQGI